MSTVRKVVLGMLAAALAVVAAGAAWVALSPMPVVYLLRYGFSGDESLRVPDGYAERAALVTVERDLTYPSEDSRNTFDLYLPDDLASKASEGGAAAEAAPVVVWIHGGAFVAGDKSGIEGWGTMLASEGYAVAAVNYEWAPETTYPGQVRQVEEFLAALGEMAENGAPFDMDRVVIAGDSAGAHIAAQACLLATNPAYGQAIGVDSSLSADQVAGALLMCGPYDIARIAEVDSPTVQFLVDRLGWAFFGDRDWQEGDAAATTTIRDYATSNFPPSFVTDGNSGSFEREGRELADALEGLGVRCESLFFDASDGEIGHEYQMDLTTPQGQEAYARELAFLQEVAPVR